VACYCGWTPSVFGHFLPRCGTPRSACGRTVLRADASEYRAGLRCLPQHGGFAPSRTACIWGLLAAFGGRARRGLRPGGATQTRDCPRCPAPTARSSASTPRRDQPSVGARRAPSRRPRPTRPCFAWCPSVPAAARDVRPVHLLSVPSGSVLTNPTRTQSSGGRHYYGHSSDHDCRCCESPQRARG
jgi:hypothetical protein